MLSKLLINLGYRQTETETEKETLRQRQIETQTVRHTLTGKQCGQMDEELKTRGTVHINRQTNKQKNIIARKFDLKKKS